SFEPTALQNGLEITTNQVVGQTFTVTQSGVLKQIDLLEVYQHRATPTVPLNVEVRTAELGPVYSSSTPAIAPTSTVLASTTFPASAFTMDNSGLSANTVSWDLSSFNINVTAGQSLAIVLWADTTPGGATYAWWGMYDKIESTVDHYPGGTSQLQQP